MYKHLLKYYLGDEDQAHFVMHQVLALENVYKGLRFAWEAYSRAQCIEEGPFKDSCICYYASFPVFEGKDYTVVFYHTYCLTNVEGIDQVQHRLLYAQEPFISRLIMSIFDEIYFHHNDIKPKKFLKVFESVLARRIQ